MNSKVTFPELVDAVAAATECPKRVSELFLKELFTVISEALRNGESVRVRGLGLFKLTNVEARKSVNVNTGEEMEIPSHRKVSFVPEKALADAINAPFVGFETVVLDDDLSEEDIQLMASVDDFDTEEQATPPTFSPEQPSQPVAVPIVQPQTVEQPVAVPIVQPQTVEQPVAVPIVQPQTVEQPVAVPLVQPQTVEQPVAEPIVQPEPITEKQELTTDTEDMKEPLKTNEDTDVQYNIITPETKPTEVEDYNIPEDDDEEYVTERKPVSSEKSNDGFMRGFIWGAVSMFVFYLIVGGGYFMYQHIQNQEIIDTARGTDSIEVEATPEEVNEAPAEPAAEETQTADAQKSEAEAEKPATEPEKPAAEPKAAEPVYDTVTERQFLTKIAAKHYGNADFWVYIYEENRSIIKNPNTIAPGTKVVIPPASKYGIDNNNPESLRAARKKIQEIENKK